DALAAIKAAVEMHGRLELLNYQLRLQHLPTIKFGIGIHTGPLVGGTVGNRRRLNYSLFGDTVNVAARIESLTKKLPETTPYKLLVSGDTRHYTQAKFPLERVQSTQLRGRKGTIEVYTLKSQRDTSPTPSSSSVVTPIDRVQRGFPREVSWQEMPSEISPDNTPDRSTDSSAPDLPTDSSLDISSRDISSIDISQWDAS
ncbi:MAG: adenylate/guanylate cyclase domain-containing protein, partial [Cyanobacteria bacterium J06632_22]